MNGDAASPLGTEYWSITGYLRHFFRFSLNVYRYQFILLGRMGLYESELSCPRIQYNHPSRARRQTISYRIQRATYKATAPSTMHLIWSNTNFTRNDVYKGWDLVKMPWKKLEWWIDRRRYLEQTLKKEAENFLNLTHLRRKWKSDNSWWFVKTLVRKKVIRAPLKKLCWAMSFLVKLKNEKSILRFRI